MSAQREREEPCRLDPFQLLLLHAICTFIMPFWYLPSPTLEEAKKGCKCRIREKKLACTQLIVWQL
eukprot:1159411-Pelagomonas_calceolata.AAC.14